MTSPSNSQPLSADPQGGNALNARQHVSHPPPIDLLSWDRLTGSSGPSTRLCPVVCLRCSAFYYLTPHSVQTASSLPWFTDIEYAACRVSVLCQVLCFLQRWELQGGRQMCYVLLSQEGAQGQYCARLMHALWALHSARAYVYVSDPHSFNYNGPLILMYCNPGLFIHSFTIMRRPFLALCIFM